MLLEDQQHDQDDRLRHRPRPGPHRKGEVAAKTKVYTEGYAPPEQIIGKPEPRSDLFALAGTMYHLATGKAPEGFYTAQELRRSSTTRRRRCRRRPLVLRADQDQPGRGRQRALFHGPRDQGRPGQAAGDQRGCLPEMPADQQGARAVLQQVRRAADRRDAALPPLRQDQSHGQPLLYSLRQSFALNARLQLARIAHDSPNSVRYPRGCRDHPLIADMFYAELF